MALWLPIPIAASIIAVQSSTDPVPTSNPPVAAFFVLALALFVVGLFVLVFIRTSQRRASKH
jgi:ABC-type phosphate transport system permease subunit